MIASLVMLFALLVSSAPCAPVHTAAMAQPGQMAQPGGAAHPGQMASMPCCHNGTSVSNPMLCCTTHSQPAEQGVTSSPLPALDVRGAQPVIVPRTHRPAPDSPTSPTVPPPLLRTPLRI